MASSTFRAGIIRTLLLTILVLLLLPQSASADQLVLNGAFAKDISGWRAQDIKTGIIPSWDSAGFPNMGSLRLSSNGRNRAGDIRLSQKISLPIMANRRGKLSFTWKKNWTGILPSRQHIYINIIKPDFTEELLWQNRVISNNNEWSSSTIDLSPFFDKTGTYTIVIGASFANGNSRNASVHAWFDEMILDVPTEVKSSPKTALLSPTGLTKISGDTFSVMGTAVDETGVKQTELAIVRFDNAWWNGNSWVKKELWNKVRPTSGTGTPSMTWTYRWQLPTSDAAPFTILARSTDISGNREVIPVQMVIRVDNVGPVGNIFIENGAKYAHSPNITVFNAINGATKMRFSVDNSDSWSAWEVFAPAKAIKLSKLDQTRIVNAQFKDENNNIYQISDEIVLDTVPPVTRHVFPNENATKVATSARISVVFYEDMDPASLINSGSETGSTFYIKQGSRWIAATASYEAATKTARLQPLAPFNPGATYTVFMTNGIKDKAGNELAAKFSWKFTTAGSFQAYNQANIGKTAGTLSGKDGLISLAIPQGSLTTDTVVKVEELNDSDIPNVGRDTRYSPVYRFTPNNLQLLKPATLIIRFKREQVPDPKSLVLLRYTEQRRVWEPVTDARIDLVNNMVIAPYTEFSLVTMVSREAPAPPATTIVSPTGYLPLPGSQVEIRGIANDGEGIAKVEVAVIRRADGSYWNGTAWQKREVWSPATIVDGSSQKQASWRYIWQLPKERQDIYIIRARSTDTGGALEPNPHTVQVKLAAK